MRVYLDWTYDRQAFARLPDIVKYLHSMNMHYVPIVDPGISNQQPAGTYPPYDRGLDMNVFMRDSRASKPIVGKVRALARKSLSCVTYIWVKYSTVDLVDRIIS